MRLTARTAGLVLLCAAIVAVAVVIPVAALRAPDQGAFDGWVGWAGIASLPVLAVSVVLLLWDKITASGSAESAGTGRFAGELAGIVLAQSAVARSRLIGAGEPGDEAANVRLARGAGWLREAGGASEGDLESVLEYYRSLTPGRLVVLGDPGAGKTVLALELIVRLLESRGRESDEPVPVLVSAAAFDTRLGWDGWLALHLTGRFGLSAEVSRTLIRDGLILPVVDGLDEMDPGTDPRRARALVAALNASMRGRARAPLVVTCRTADYQALARDIDRATHVRMLPLSGSEAAGYLAAKFRGRSEQQRWEPVLAVLRANPAGPLAAQLATPWRLTLALAAFRAGGDPMTLAPADAPGGSNGDRLGGLLMDRYIEAAVSLYRPPGRYTASQVRQWLTALAEGLDRQASRGGSATDISLAEWWRPAARNSAAIAHVCLAAMPALIALACLLALAAPVTALPLVFAVIPIFGLAFAPEPHRVNLRRLRDLGLARAAVVFTSILMSAPNINLLNDPSPLPLNPRDVIRADGRYGFTVGLWSGLAGVILFVFSFKLGLAVALVDAVAAGLTTGLTGSGCIWTRYHVTVALAAARGRGPLQFGRFLDWAAEAGLMRVSGVSYQFRHRQMQDRLVATRSARP